MNVGLYYKMDLYDQHMNLLHSGRRRKSRSYVQAHLAMLQCAMKHATVGSMIVTGGTVAGTLIQDQTATYLKQWSLGEEGAAPSTNTSPSATTGLLIGYGTLAPTITDYCLGSMASHGSQANEIVMQANWVGTLSTTATTSRLLIVRNFRNDTVATLTFREVGAVARFNAMVGSTGGAGYDEWPFLVWRDTITPMHIGPGQTAALTYEESIAI